MQLVNISVQKKSTEGFPFNHAICVYKYLNRSMAILNMTVLPILIVSIRSEYLLCRSNTVQSTIR